MICYGKRNYRPNNKRWAQIKCPVCPEKIVLDYADTVQRPPPPPAPPKTRYLKYGTMHTPEDNSPNLTP